MIISIWGPVELIRGPVRCSRALRARCAAPMPPDPVGWRERSRAQHSTHPGARPVLGRFAPSALPMPPDPVGWRERSRAQPPAHVAQAAEHFLGKEEVTGSNPVVGLGTGRARCAI